MPQETKRMLRNELEEQINATVTTASKGGDPASVSEEAASLSEREDLTPEAAAHIRAQKKAKIAQVLLRGVMGDRLLAVAKEAVPEGYGYKWALDRPEDVIRYSGFGFGFNYRPDAKGTHGSADGRIRIGDLVLMTAQREDIEILREVRADNTKRRLGAPRKEFSEAVHEEADRTGLAVAPFDHSQTVIDRRSERL